jgi:hypothetical protein
VRFGRDRAGAGRRGDQDGHRGARGQGRAAVGQAAARKGRVPEHEGRDRLLPAQSDNFFVGNAFPTCGINFTAQEIMGQSEANK